MSWDQKESSDERYTDFIVNARSVKSLYDTGATKAAIRKVLKKPDQYTGKYAWCKCVNGTTAKYQLANVEVEGEHFRGLVQVMVVPNLLKEMIITPKQYIRPVKSKTDSSNHVDEMQVSMKVNWSATDEAEVQTEEPSERYEGSNIKCRSAVTEETIANYALRSEDRVKEHGVKPLRWPALKEWKLTPADVLDMQKQDPTLEKYWKMARGETQAKGSKKEHVQFVMK